MEASCARSFEHPENVPPIWTVIHHMKSINALFFPFLNEVGNNKTLRAKEPTKLLFKDQVEVQRSDSKRLKTRTDTIIESIEDWYYNSHSRQESQKISYISVMGTSDFTCSMYQPYPISSKLSKRNSRDNEGQLSRLHLECADGK